MDKKRNLTYHATMHGEEMQYIQYAFETNWVAPLGPNVTGFEEDIIYTGIKHATALSAGTSSNSFGFQVLGMQGISCSAPRLHFQQRQIRLHMSVGCLYLLIVRKRLGTCALRHLNGLLKYPEAKAVIVANLYGTPAKLDQIAAICKKHGVPMIEDAAESLGATYQGIPTGRFGDIGIFSFNGNKIITSSGGGMMVSDNEAYTKKALFLATQSREPAKHYEHKEIGYNYRMSNVVAGIGRGQMKHLDEHVA